MQWGYNFSENFYRMIALKYVNRGLTFSDFAYSGIRIKTLTSEFMAMDYSRNAIISLSYSTFIQLYASES